MKYINIIITLCFITLNVHASPKVGGGGVFFTNPKVGISEDVASKIGGGGVSSKVETGGVFSIERPMTELSVSGEEMGDSYNDGTTFEISDAMLGKLKKLGVEKLLLENGETVDLSGDVNAY